jgi:Bacterial dnaA protein helix-turn-helix
MSLLQARLHAEHVERLRRMGMPLGNSRRYYGQKSAALPLTPAAPAPLPEEPVEPYAPGDGTVTDVTNAVAFRFQLEPAALTGRDRHPAVNWARFIACFLAHRLTGRSISAIAEAFGRDHSTVIHGNQRIARKRAADAMFARELIYLESCLTLRMPVERRNPLPTYRKNDMVLHEENVG